MLDNVRTSEVECVCVSVYVLYVVQQDTDRTDVFALAIYLPSQ